MNKSSMYKGLLEPIILNLLTENKRMYGYEITSNVKELTKGELNITEGALYPLLHRLEASGVLKAEMENVGNRIRKYYSLTKEGKRYKKYAINDLRNLVETLQLLLKPQIT